MFAYQPRIRAAHLSLTRERVRNPKHLEGIATDACGAWTYHARKEVITVAPSHCMSLVSAIKDFFGEHPDGNTRLIAEFKSLTDKDKADLRELLTAEGYVLS